MELGLYQEQRLKLMMTNELRQAITLLQYSGIELSEFIHQQALENPLMELKEQNHEIYKTASADYDKNRSSKSSQREKDPLDFVSNDEVSVYDYLLMQASFLRLTEDERRRLEYLILMLDENGYLKHDIDEIAEHIGESSCDVKDALMQLQEFDPAGVGASNIVECLLLQLKRKFPEEIVAYKIVNNYLQELADKKWKQIAKDLNISLNDVQKAFDLIQLLHPKPGLLIGKGPMPKYITPDLIVEKNKGDYAVFVNDHFLPKININDVYLHMLQSNQSDSEAVHYLQEKYQQVHWLLKSIEQRKVTLYNVMTAIVEKQKAFFEKGECFLSPMTLKEVAEAIDIHESTVSRATTDKYVQTPHGLFELKYFFTSSLKTENGKDTSSLHVKQLIKELIDHENKSKPLSDQKISALLKKEDGVVVSRRTVTKYREQLNIPSSSKRKRFE